MSIHKFPFVISLEDSGPSKHYLPMNSIFQSYPTHPWLTEWRLEPRGCKTAFREKNAGYFFRTLDTIGNICPNRDSPEWSIQIPIPQNSHIKLLFNGFCGYLDQKKTTFSAEVITPEPGVLWGRFSNIPDPVLLTVAPVVETEGFQWLDSDTSPALLAVRDGIFCLVTKAHLFTDAAQLAKTYLEKDLEANLIEEFKYRAEASKLFEQINYHDALAAISTESMMRALRPPDGNIPKIWSQSATTNTPQFNTNELYSLALAWKHIDIATAEDLVRSVLKLQTSSGAIPVTYSPRETFSVLEAPKPLIAKTAEIIWLVRKDPQFLADVIQPLRRYLQWLLHHFDPKRRGLHCWQNRDELLIPETYKSDLATADLTILLLTEIEALNQLQKALKTDTNLPPYFQEERDTLVHNLQTQYWDENTAQFSKAILRGKIIQVQGFPAFIPLLWKKLPKRQKDLILDQIKESGTLPGGMSVLSWHTSTLDNNSFPLLQQLIVLEMLKTADPYGTMVHDITRATLQGFVEWHTLSVEKHGKLEIDPVMASYIINLTTTQYGRYNSNKREDGFLSKLLQKAGINRFDLAIILITMFTIFSVHLIYQILHQPPPFVILETQMNSAYARKNEGKVLQNSKMIIKYYPEKSSVAKLLAGNIMLVQNNYAGAVSFFSDIREKYPDSPGPMIALGLAHQLQGEFSEAEENYAEFIYLFDEIFPSLTETVQQFSYLMQEGFRSPPKWSEIYRYQLMHEL